LRAGGASGRRGRSRFDPRPAGARRGGAQERRPRPGALAQPAQPALERGFIVAGWNGDAAIEAKIKEETKATIRVMPMGDPIEAECVYTGQKGREVYFAQAY